MSTSNSAIALSPIVWDIVSPLKKLLKCSIDDILQLNTLLLSIAVDELDVEAINDIRLFDLAPSFQWLMPAKTPWMVEKHASPLPTLVDPPSLSAIRASSGLTTSKIFRPGTVPLAFRSLSHASFSALPPSMKRCLAYRFHKSAA
jgi:hypothetical protein